MFREAAVLPERPTVNLPRNKDFEERQRGHMHEAKLNIPLNVPSPLLPQSSVQKGHGIFSGISVFDYCTLISMNIAEVYGRGLN